MEDLFLLRLEKTLTTAIEKAVGAAAHQTPDELLAYTDVMKILKVGSNDAYRIMEQLHPMKLGRLKVRRRTLEEWLAANAGNDMTDLEHPVKIESIA